MRIHSIVSPVIAAGAVFLLPPNAARACDLCGCYMPDRGSIQNSVSGFYLGFAEQFTHFGNLTFNGDNVDNPSGQYVNSFNTQAVVGYSFWRHRLGIQLNVPYIYREYRRPDGFDIERGSVSGLGDISLVVNTVVWQTKSSPDGCNGWLNLTAGIKLPTGDTSRLQENFHEEEIPGAPENAIGGHDLTLGSGAIDGVFGLQFQLKYQRFFFQADAQFSWRGDGDYDYRFANDLTWSGGPGVYCIQQNDKTLGLELVLSGETKGYDHFQGEADVDSGITALYAGPRIVAAWGRINGEAGVDLPVVMNNTQLQATAEYRIRAGFSIQF